MKLELKHLVPYLPYGLKIWNIDMGVDFDLTIQEEDEGIDIESILYCKSNWKLILRPLSDLTDRINPIQHHTYLDGLNHNSIEKIQDLIMKGILYLEDYNYLIEYHFDVFGLIEQGLAIDINTLNDEKTNNIL